MHKSRLRWFAGIIPLMIFTLDVTFAATAQVSNPPDIGMKGLLAEPTVSSNTEQTGSPPPAENPDAVLWDQPLSTIDQSAYVNQEFPDFTTFSSFLADDFTNTQAWSISSIFIPGDGFGGFTSLFNASALTWQIYADNAGIPAGDPSGGGNPPLWSLTLSPVDPQVVITSGTPGGFPSNTQLNLSTPLELPPATYWLVFYPTMDYATYGQFGRQAADTTNGYSGQFINPGGGFGYGTAWQDWSVLGATQADIAFRLEGEAFSLVTWEKYINGVSWTEGMTITVQTMDIVTVQQVLHLDGSQSPSESGTKTPDSPGSNTLEQSNPQHGTQTALQVPVFSQIENWDNLYLHLLDWAASGGDVFIGDGQVVWSGEILGPGTITLSLWFQVQPSTWMGTTLWEELWLDGTKLEERPVTVLKQQPELWVDAVYDPNVYTGEQVAFSVQYGNDGGFENDVVLRSNFPAEAPFSNSNPLPSDQDPGGLWAEWNLGDLPAGTQGSIDVTIAVQPDVPPATLLMVWDGLYNHAGELADELYIGFQVHPFVDLGVVKVAPALVYTGNTFYYTLMVTNYGPDEATGIILQDTLPSNVSYISDDASCSYYSGVLTCSIPYLPAVESLSISILVSANTAGTATNTVDVSSLEYDVDLNNNAAAVDTLVVDFNAEVDHHYLPLVYKQ